MNEQCEIDNSVTLLFHFLDFLFILVSTVVEIVFIPITSCHNIGKLKKLGRKYDEIEIEEEREREIIMKAK